MKRPAKGPRGTQAKRQPPKEEIQDRMNEIEDAMMSRVAQSKILAHFSEKFEVTHRTIRKYQLKIRNRWRKEAEELGPDERIARRDAWRASLDHVFSMAVRDNDLKVAVQAAKLAIGLDALSVPTKQSIEIDDKRQPLSTRTPAELIAFLNSGRLPAEGSVAAGELGAGSDGAGVGTGAAKANGAGGNGAVH